MKDSKYPNGRIYEKGSKDSKTRTETTLKNAAHKIIKTGQNTQESPVENQKSDFATPFYNMGEKVLKN